MASKPEHSQNQREIVYSSEHWAQFNRLRAKALPFLLALENRHIGAIIYGSIARGDVHRNSDIDVFISEPPSAFQIETALEQAKIIITARTIIQATPNYAMKGYIEIAEVATVSFPLMPLRRVEREFYRFSGEVAASQLQDGIRVAGVNKRLMLIEPTAKGNLETNVLGQEEQAAKRLGVAVETVQDRVHTLLKRDAVGRTGVFIKKELDTEETFEMAMQRVIDVNPAARRRMRGKS
jgi:uncharacterized protein